MPPHILQDVKHKLRIEFNAVLIHRTINRPNIFYQVNEMIYPVSTRWDLLQAVKLDGSQSFMIFANTRRETEAEMIKKLKKGELWGICCTDAAEPKYLDKNQLKRKCGENDTGRKHTVKRAQASNRVGTSLDVEEGSEDGDSEGEKEEGENDERGRQEMEPDTPLAQPLVADCTQQTAASLRYIPPSPLSAEFEVNAMDTYINAGLQGICRRAIIDKYFDNPKLLLPKQTRAKHKFKFNEPTMTPKDLAFCQALEEWREREMVESGLGEDDFFGPQLILADGILNRIIAVAHHLKLTDIASLKDQTGWRNSKKYGASIISLFLTHYLPPPPPPLFTTGPLPICTTIQQPLNSTPSLQACQQILQLLENQ
ncbi:hypothetical protein SERLADRAFT_404560 [Serpula lacrymans var. lacrymans S7.9]|uniref:Uncharacterized protein n=1 Tax=Serpula lacrymans var. lacrymans (strain S7.9) TaxID=578457 RepID=F8NE25_SERL9|nr:uncharacterized protein SERLADRAFT_404560 [Serpula lacrymans var. lacrymans S7.9]EGO30354.1 hypothetical protein SERLADRAFT_404560 [Serpula lacrymans var. lacrymans S7.9]